MSIMDNEGHDPQGLGNIVSRYEMNRVSVERAELLAALKSVMDQTNAIQHDKETRLNDIFDIASAAVRKVCAP